MGKIIIATHERLAEGFKHTLDYIAPGTVDVLTLSAYVENKSIEEELAELLTHYQDGEQLVILTDLLGGSVNQECTKLLTRDNTFLVTGINFPLVLSLALEMSQGALTDETVRYHIEESRNQMVFVNDIIKQMALDLDDE